MDWAKRFIGLPYEDKGRSYEGADCWGIAYLVWRDVFGSSSFPILGTDYSSVDKLDEVFGTFMAHAVDFELVDYDERIPGDVLMFRLQGVPVHAGVVVDNDKMIHSLPGHACVFEQYSGVRWRRRIEGVYRWVS